MSLGEILRGLIRRQFFPVYESQKAETKAKYGTSRFCTTSDKSFDCQGILVPRTPKLVALHLVGGWSRAYTGVEPDVRQKITDAILGGIADAPTRSSAWTKTYLYLQNASKIAKNASGPDLTAEQSKAFWDQLFQVSVNLDDVVLTPDQLDLFMKIMGEAIPDFSLPTIPSWWLYAGVGLFALWLLKR